MTVGLIDSAIKAYPYMDLWLLWDILSEKVWLSGSDLLQTGLSHSVFRFTQCEADSKVWLFNFQETHVETTQGIDEGFPKPQTCRTAS